MAAPSIQELRARRIAAARRDDAALNLKAQVQDSSDLAAGQLRVFIPSRRQQVIITAKSYRAGVWVYLRENAAGELYVHADAIADAIDTFGSAVDTAYAPQNVSVSGTNWRIDASNLKIGQVRASSNYPDSLYVYVEPFYFNGGTIGGGLDFDVSSHLPAAAGLRRWVSAEWDTTANTLNLIDGTDSGLPSNDLLDPAAIPPFSAGSIPLAAFTLAYGQTAASASRFVHAGNFLGKLRGAGYDEVQDNGSALAQRSAVNLIAGTNITLTISDDSGNDRTDVLIAASGGSGSGSATDYIEIRHEATSGTNGGTFTSGSWQTRPLTTEVTDTGNHASLSSNQITLAAGTYRLRARAVGALVNWHQLRFQNVTDGTTISEGEPVFAASASPFGATLAHVSRRFTIASTKTFELQHQCQTTRSTDGFGSGRGFGTEVFATVELEREA